MRRGMRRAERRKRIFFLRQSFSKVWLECHELIVVGMRVCILELV